MKRKKFILGCSTWFGILLGWQLLVMTNWVPGALVPSPQSVFVTFGNLLVHGYGGTTLREHFLITMYRLGSALLLAVVLGVPLGMLSGYFEKVQFIVEPLVQFIRPIPPLAYYTLLILWLGITDSSKIGLLLIAAFAPVYLASLVAVKKVPQKLIQSAQSLGASSKQVFTYVIFPAALPEIFTGIRIASGVAYTTIVSAEMVAASSGIGWMIIDASRYLKSSVMFVGIIILGVTGICLDLGVKQIAQYFTKWSSER